MATDSEVVYIALSTEDPLDDASRMSEPVGNGYARVAHRDWYAPSDNVIWNDGTIWFPQASGDWGTITHYALYSELIGGEMLAHGALVRSVTMSRGRDCSIASGAIMLSHPI